MIILKFAVLGIPLYGLMLYAFFFPMNYMPVEYSMWREEKDYISKEQGADTLIIGDSRAKSGIMTRALGDEDTYNMAIGGCTPIEMYYALEGYLKNNPPPKRVIIIFAQYHLCDIDNWGQTMTYNYLTLPQLLEVYGEAEKNGESQVLGEHFFTDLFSYKLRLPNKYLSSIYNANINGRYGDNAAKYESVRQDGGYTVFGEDEGNDGLSYEVHHPEFDSLKTVLDYYYRLLELCSSNGISVIIEQAPVNESSMERISEDFWKGYGSFMSDVKSRYPDFQIVETVPEYENRYFGDNNHLNKEGAGVFTEYIKNRYYDMDREETELNGEN